MKKQLLTLNRRLLSSGFIFGLVVLTGSLVSPLATAHDLNPAPYRGAPLSVFAHWFSQNPGGPLPVAPNEFSFVGDGIHDLWPQPPSANLLTDPTGGAFLEIFVPNFVDEELLKMLRIQVSWTGPNPMPPGPPNVVGVDNGNTVPGQIVFESPISPFTQPPGGYIYWDIEIRPNPDFEIIQLAVPSPNVIDQIVIDSVSTVPEPGTVTLLGLGIALVTSQRRSRMR